MGTTNFGFNLIDPAARFDGANDINELAQQIDDAVKQVEVLGRDATYTLPTATNTRLGGVRIGANVNVSADGTISTSVDPYVLPPASRTALGGVKVPTDSGLNITPDGVLSINDSSVTLPAGSVGSEQLKDGAVTNVKIADGAVTEENLSSSLQQLVNEAQAYAKGGTSEVALQRLVGDEGSLKARRWGNMVLLDLSGLSFTIASATDRVSLAKFANASDEPNGTPAFGISTIPYFMNSVERGYCAGIYTKQSLAGTPDTFDLRFNGNLTAGTYTATGTLAFLWV